MRPRRKTPALPSNGEYEFASSPSHSNARLYQPQPLRPIAREYRVESRIPEVRSDEFPEHVAEVRRQRQVPALVELLLFEAWPLPVHLAALHAAAHDEHGVGMAVIGPA